MVESRTIVVPADFSTIQEAINNATEGDQVFVLNGTYHENVVVNKTIMLVGEDRNITIIDGNGSSFGVNVVSDDVCISGFTIRNSSGNVVQVFNVNNCNLTGNSLAQGSVGVHLLNSGGGCLVGNHVSSAVIGVCLKSCNGTLVEGNNVTDSQDAAVLMSNSSKVVADSNFLSKSVNQGLFLNYSSGNVVSGNMIFNNAVGLRLQYSNGNVVTGNDATNNGLEGFSLYSSNGNNMSGNVIRYNGFGLRLTYSGNNTLRSNSILSNDVNFGVEAAALSSFTNDIDTSNKINGKDIYYLVNRKDLVLNSGSNAGYVAVVNSDDIVVRDLTLTDNNEGLLCVYSDRCAVENNTFMNNRLGVYIYNSNLVSVKGNVVNGSSDKGMFISECYSISVEDNVITKSALGVSLYSFMNSSLVRNNVTGNLDRGIQMLGSNNNFVSQNLMSGNTLDGMYAYNSHNNTLSENQAIGNMRDGIWVDTCINNTLIHNNVSRNAANGIYLLTSIRCQVRYNNVVGNNFVGLQLSVDANNNSIVGNYLSENVRYGISLYDCSYNRIFSNNFVNRYQAQVFLGSSNSWDNSYPEGGNFWSDYVGADLFWGPYQNITGSDGTGDTPYIINSDNRDRYPMISQTRVHDVAVLSASVSLDQPYQGWSIGINLTAKNVGDYVESFNVTVFCDGSVIGTFKVNNLPIQESVSLAFEWNTSGLTPCHTYSVRCQADPVSGETSLEDNTYVAGNVHIKMMGDVDGDGKINIIDIAQVATSFQSKVGDARYRLARDLNRDGLINILDISLAAQNFGKSCV
jgi:parallel beta-helix repeat protein